MFGFIKTFLLNRNFKNSLYYFEKELTELARFSMMNNMPFFFNMSGIDHIKDFKIELILMKNHKLNNQQLNTITAVAFGMDKKVQIIKDFINRKSNEIILFDGYCLRFCNNDLMMYKVFDHFIYTMKDAIKVISNLEN